MADGLFSGVRVVELGQYVFVPSAAAVLADLGADVIKVEPPVTGDPYRRLHRATNGDTAPSFQFVHCNRGKRSIAIDIRDPDGRAVLLRLVENADVFLTSLRPQALRRARLEPKDLRSHHPRLIYARGHGYGVNGPDAERPGYDASAFWARGGIATALTEPEMETVVRQRPAMGDNPAGMHLAFGVAAALFRRERTGVGSVVDVSLLATAMWALAMDVMRAIDDDDHPQGAAVERPSGWNPLTEPFRTSDGRWLQLLLLEPDRYWRELCEVVGRPDLATNAHFIDAAARQQHADECLVELRVLFAARTLAEWRRILADFSGPWEAMQSVADLPTDPQVLANGYLTTVAGDQVQVVAPPTQFDGWVPTPGPAPSIGEHTDEVLLAVGLSEKEVESLRARGVVG